MRRYSIAALFLVICAAALFLLSAFASIPQPPQTSHYELQIEELATGLNHPWSLAFLPDGQMLVTERPGRLLIISSDGQEKTEVTGLPPISAKGQGGLLDVALHPQFNQNQLIYFSFSASGEGGVGTEVARAQLIDGRLRDIKRIFQLQPKSSTGRHFGSRLVFNREGLLYITLGDRGEKNRAQRLDDHAGSVIRLNDDGSIPVDNPFFGQTGNRYEIYSYGHRNMQGAALHPQTGLLWTQEHGPQGGDEVNIIRPGTNYGWPVITYGVNYGSGTKIGEGTHKEGMAQPIYTWVPSIAPSGMLFYTGDKFPHWKGNLFVGALKDQMLVRLELDGEKIIAEERMLKKTLGRIRDVRQGLEGYIYLLTDHDDGKLVRLRPN
jgi:aldose sugar dehydrogenase